MHKKRILFFGVLGVSLLPVVAVRMAWNMRRLGKELPTPDGDSCCSRWDHLRARGPYGASFLGGPFSSVYWVDAAINFLTQRPNSGRPFLMPLSFSAAEDPFTSSHLFCYSDSSGKDRCIKAAFTRCNRLAMGQLAHSWKQNRYGCSNI